jgi:hypothetical protein
MLIIISLLSLILATPVFFFFWLAKLTKVMLGRLRALEAEIAETTSAAPAAL